ncbi:hypothetical protein [Roseicyclus marinus]|nr:hypothetical protein [Roseicyclus marinus]
MEYPNSASLVIIDQPSLTPTPMLEKDPVDQMSLKKWIAMLRED